MSKVITIYELLGLIKDGKAPKKILYRDDYFYEYKYNKELKDYEDINTGDLLFIDRYNANEILENTIEILEDEEEFEDIEEIKLGNEEYYSKRYKQDIPISMAEDEIIRQVNQLIRNQKKIIERLNNGK